MGLWMSLQKGGLRRLTLVSFALFIIALGLHRPLPPHPSDATGWPAIGETLYIFLLWGYLWLLGTAIGLRVLKPFHLFTINNHGKTREPSPLPPPPAWSLPLWALPTGLILLGYLGLALGVIGRYQRPWLAGLLLLLTVWNINEIEEGLSAWLGLFQRAKQHFQHLPKIAQGGWLVIGILLGCAWIMAWIPPWDYDPLWYHLQAPRLFLQAGRVYPEWNNWPANYAFAANLLYGYALALGDDIVPQLLHWSFTFAFFSLTFVIARQARPWSWLAPAAVMVMPQFMRFASQAWVDFAVAALEFMAYSALLIGLPGGPRPWLWASAFWAGLAAGTKISALAVPATGALAVLTFSSGNTKQRFYRTFQYVVIASLIASPWYAKNMIYFGTPLFPWGYQFTDPEQQLRLILFLSYNSNPLSGVKRWLALFWSLFQPGSIRTALPGSPTIFIPLIILLYSMKENRLKMISKYILIIFVYRYAFWILPAPLWRFLFALVGLLGVGLAYSLSISSGYRQVTRYIIQGFYLSLTLYFSFWAAKEISKIQAWKVLLGQESRRTMAYKTSPLAAWDFANQFPSEQTRIFLVADARLYYCKINLCYPESDEFAWTHMAWAAGFNSAKMMSRLQREGITHLWINFNTAFWLLAYEPTGLFQRSYRFLMGDFLPRCTQPVYGSSQAGILLVKIRPCQ